MSDRIPPPIRKPGIVIPDSGPLIHLAQAGLLHEAGGAVVVVDMVAKEVTHDVLSKRRPTPPPRPVCPPCITRAKYVRSRDCWLVP